MINLQYLADRFSALDEAERGEMFQVLTNHKELFNKLLPNIPLLMHILDPENVPSGVQTDLVQAYRTWAQGAKE